MNSFPPQPPPPGEAHRDRYWRAIEQMTRTREFQHFVEGEFAAGASEWPRQLDRRSFVSLMAASFALAGLTGCTRQPLEEILPFVKQPEEITPGKPLYYATAMPLGGFGTGILVKSREGRPIKADGNPLHPSSLGGSSLWIQAWLLDLYDPDRARSVNRSGLPGSWPLFTGTIRQALIEQRRKKGAGLRILSGTVTSPTLFAQMQQLLEEFPEARWHCYEPVNLDNIISGSQLAFGEYVATHCDLRKAKVILSLDSDFLHTHPQRLRYAREFTDARRVVLRGAQMNRLYVIEPTPTITGAMADHRLPLSTDQIESAARYLASELGLTAEKARSNLPIEGQRWISAVARDLQSNRGECVVAAGPFQSPALHAIGHLLNEVLGNVGSTVHYTSPAEAAPALQLESLRELVRDMDEGRVDMLTILGGNPAFDAPADFDFQARLKKVKFSVHLTESFNETSQCSVWSIPRAHPLETWSDIRAFDGTATIMQPLIAPLFEGRSEHELLAVMQGASTGQSSYQIVREFWRGQNLWEDFEKGWRRAVHDGVVEGTASPVRQVRVRARELAGASPEVTTGSDAIEVTFRPDPNLWDGRFANNPWLQEAPRPISTLVWDNAVIVSPRLAEQEGLATGDLVELRVGTGSVKAPALIMPGQAPLTVTLHLGQGRIHAGRAGRQVGFNFYPLRSASGMSTVPGLALRKTGERHPLVTTQTHHRLGHEDRQIHRTGTLEEFRANPGFVQEHDRSPAREETLYEPGEFDYERKWGMSIDLTTCIGCNACVVACNIENNIPVVGRQQVAMSREMLWLRVDTYFQGVIDNPVVHFEPVPCMHCENAPCEYVCPVEASVHDSEGLNLQVYNRCVGTRYCSNNCPYKVRRFNFLNYAKLSEIDALRQNPEVTVRSRGVMEKCTYCVQRIAAARIEAKKGNRGIADGEVRTACQEACPTSAIVFGLVTDPESEVARYKRHALDFSMLGQLNTRPRTTYLARLTNPNPALQSPGPSRQPDTGGEA